MFLPGSPVEVELHRYGRTGALSVRNEGLPLPQEMGGRLFESMVSIRPRTGDITRKYTAATMPIGSMMARKADM